WNGVAAEIAQEVAVLFEDDDVNAGAREQHAEHHAGRSAAGDAAARLERFGGVRHSVGLFTRRNSNVSVSCGHRASSMPDTAGSVSSTVRRSLYERTEDPKRAGRCRAVARGVRAASARTVLRSGVRSATR